MMIAAAVSFAQFLGPLAPNAACQLDVLWHDGDAFGVNRAKVRVLEETDQVRLTGLLQRHDGGTLETEIGFEILRYFSDQSLEGQLSDEQLGTLLVTTDLSEGDSAGPVAMGFLHATGRWGALPGGFRGELFAGRFTTGGFTCGLFGTSHRLLCTAAKSKVCKIR